MILPAIGVQHYEHEDYSVLLATELGARLGLDWAEEDKIKDVITNGGREQHNGLCEIVSNKVFGIDVDRMDYLRRDSVHYGVVCPFSHKDYLNAFQIVQGDEKKNKVLFRRDKLSFLNQFLEFRTKLYEEQYYSHDKLAACLMITDLFVENESRWRVAEKIQTKEGFLQLDDQLVYSLGRDLHAQSQNSKDIYSRLLNNDTYQFLGKVTFSRSASKDMILRFIEQKGVDMTKVVVSEGKINARKDVQSDFEIYDGARGEVTLLSDAAEFTLFNKQYHWMQFFCRSKPDEEKLQKIFADILRELGTLLKNDAGIN